MTEQELHPVIQLLMARMKSHPEEFEFKGYGRWQYALDIVRTHGSEEEKAAIQHAMREVHLEEAHVWALDELCNGEERRKEEERHKEEAQSAYRQAQTALSQKMALNQYSSYANTIGVTTAANSIQLGSETLDESALAKIKRSLGL